MKKESWRFREIGGERRNTRERPEKGRSDLWALVNAESLGLSPSPDELMTGANAELIFSAQKRLRPLARSPKSFPSASADKSNLLLRIIISSRARYPFSSDCVDLPQLQIHGIK